MDWITFSIRCRTVCVAAIFLLPLQIMASTADHTTFEQLKGPFERAEQVTQACLDCHTEAGEQLQQSTHWTWQHGLAGSDAMYGKTNVVNNFCIATASNEPRCTSCHAGYGWKDDSFDFTKHESVDCLICHEQSGQYRKFPTDAGHPNYVDKEWPKGSGKMLPAVDLAMAAQSVATPDIENCGACHFFGGGGDSVKHGDMDSTLFSASPELDVHLSEQGANLKCQDCHTTSNHQTKGSRYSMLAKDTSGIDIPGHSDFSRASCESCHGIEPHQGSRNAIRLNQHVDNIACQTCHIPEFAREKATKTFWDWSTAGDKSRPVTKDQWGNVTYTPKKGDFVWEMNVVPEYECFNGDIDYTVVGEKVTANEAGIIALTTPQGRCGDDDSRIWPFKVMKGKQPYDSANQIMVTPHLFGKDKAAYWKTYDWDASAQAGMEASGESFSGQLEFINTEYHFPITHMVAPADKALDCQSCHSPEGRMVKLAGFHIPGQSVSFKGSHYLWWLVVLTLGVVCIHALLRVIVPNKKDKE
ncbi:tetrathionate reductase family octaheme c-type cytochrome [Photobacterium rosenbergii]|uniref:Tetrathionate reductase family octaheme c-type cytochrome n=1 Tax=Photobacterium rosenbergii TaxID=294936 RepID=A0ABU3ZHZ5_9GAMM|nr:tetrathionate reductase family octaheme c-type cytochrome [Photobacterium rosenbergii]MDV5169528.1 tetrathionate reductase family octaheme c-type cytochrome [Photobacterium rosenbergii]